jgi:hypothetical protein
MPRRSIVTLVVVSALAFSSAASASETISYTYDALGRVVKVTRTGTAHANNNNAVQTCYNYDKADNRTNVKVTTGTPLPACPS